MVIFSLICRRNGNLFVDVSSNWRCSRSGGGSTRSGEGSGDSGCVSDSRCIHI